MQGVIGAEPPQCVDPLPTWSWKKKKGKFSKKSFFNLAENCGASSLWAVPHRYTRILCMLKPLWANNAHKVEPNTGPIKNLSKSLLILKSPKTNLKFPFLIAKSSPTVTILQCCRATVGCYWTKLSKKIKMYKKRKRRKIPKIWQFSKKIRKFCNIQVFKILKKVFFP